MLFKQLHTRLILAYWHVCSQNTAKHRLKRRLVNNFIYYIKPNFLICGPILKIKTVLEMLFHYAFESHETYLNLSA
jgi:hypothetical protein